MKKNILIILVFIMVLGVGVIIGINLSNNNLSIDNDELKQQENKKYSKEELETIIDKQLNSLVNKKSLNDLTNQERLRLLLWLYSEEEYDGVLPETFSANGLREIHKKSIIKNLNVEYIDIYDYYTVFSSDEKGNREVGYRYDDKNDTYTYTGALGHGGSTVADKMYTELVSFEENDDEYILKYKYIFANQYGDGPGPYTLYYSGIDAYNRENEFKKFQDYDCSDPECNDYLTPAKEYIDDNYDSIKEKLSIYTYTFKVEDGNLIIASFSVN